MIDEFHGGSISESAEEQEEKAKQPKPPAEQAKQQVKHVPDDAVEPVQQQTQPLPTEPTQPLPPEPSASEPPAMKSLPDDEPPALPAAPLAPQEPPMQSAPVEPAAVTAEDDSNLRDQQEEEQENEAAFEAAMQLIAAGQSVEQVMGNFANLPEHIKQQLRARLQQAAAQREMQQHEMAKETRQKGLAAKAVGKLFSLGMMSGIISKGTMDKINALFVQQPHLQQQIQMTGQTLLKAGATPDIEFAKSSVQIATRAPSTPAVTQQQEQQR